MRKDFCYVYSCELNVPLRVRVVSLLGFIANSRQPSGHMLLRIAVYCNNRKVGCDVQTSYRPPTAASGSSRELQKWDELLALPIRYCELSRDAFIHITLWDVGDSVEPVFIAQCVKSLFSKHGVFRSSQLDLRLERTEDSSPDPFHRPRPAPSDRTKTSRTGADIAELLKKEKLHKENFIDHVSWLDQITFSRLAKIKEDAKTEDRSLYLTLEMPSVVDANTAVPYSVLFYVEDDENLLNTTSRSMGAANFNGTSSAGHRGVDPELGLDNLCEMKHHMMTRNARSNDIDRRLQPNPSTRDALEAIVRSPSCQPMTVEQRDLIWKFRFWLKSSPHALTKFIRSVNWEEEPEVKQAMQVIAEWEPIDACDALELLAPSFTHPFVRRYAVSRLQQTSFANILLYLPQLVQALRYEGKGNDMLFVTKPEMPTDSAKRSSMEGPTANPTEITTSILEFFGADVDLATFLIRAACENSEIANFFYWYLKVEVEANAELDEPVSEMYSQMIDRLKTSLSRGNNTARQALATINAQKKFVDTLVDMAKLVAEVSGSRAKKLEVLKKKLSENTDLMDLKASCECAHLATSQNVQALSLPLDPSIHVKSVNSDATVLFSSNLMPMKLTFSTVRGSVPPFECGEAYTTIFKRGDDLRQDQLVLQMIRLMDSLLKEDKLDLCLTPYSVLATSVSEGFVQFVRSIPLADLKGTIQDTLRQYRPSPSGPYNIEAEVLNNYVRSCAGYSIICYILGIGDRHLHNLLLCENGKMFHVDFGFILGRDPKPMPPAMKLTSEMINAMGGQQSEHFKNFVDYCATSFCILRRHANLITNLFSLMLDAGIPDIAVERDKAVQKVLERFHLNLTDESACQLVNRLIESSIAAKMPILVDFVHDMKQFISN